MKLFRSAPSEAYLSLNIAMVDLRENSGLEFGEEKFGFHGVLRVCLSCIVSLASRDFLQETCKDHAICAETDINPVSSRWLSGKLWYLQHNCVGDTIVYH